MKIVVLMKQVPDTTSITIDPQTGTLKRQGVPSIMNPEDKVALEQAIRIKEVNGAKVVCLTMGPPQAEAILREAVSMGADEVILLTDRKFAGADTIATSYALSMALNKIADYDLIIGGRQAIDGDTAQIGPQVAEFLDIPQITYAQKMQLNEDEVTVERATDQGYDIVKAKLPALVTCIKDLAEPRYPSLAGIKKAYRETEIITWGAADVSADESQLGLKGSPTWVKKSFTPPAKAPGEVLKGEAGEMVLELVKRLKVKNIL